MIERLWWHPARVSPPQFHKMVALSLEPILFQNNEKYISYGKTFNRHSFENYLF